MLRQREPLRVPREWTGEKRGFVMAVERALDGLYKLFGRLTFSDFDKDTQSRIASTEAKVFNVAGEGKEWIDNAELNDFKTPGVYLIGPGCTVGGVADDTYKWAVLHVTGGKSDTAMQTFYLTDFKHVVVRMFRANIWGDFYSLNDIVDNLTSTSVEAALSANQGKVLDAKKVDKISLTGLRSVGSGGSGGYCKILTIEITSAWRNYPLCIEGVSRGRWVSMIQIQFQNVSGTDPDLYGFWSDIDNLIYLHRSAPGVWDLYWRYNENYGNFVVHRILGCGGSTPNITEKYENVSSLPTGSIQAGLWINRELFFLSGQTYTFTDLFGYGFVTGNGTSMALYVRFQKKFAGNVSVTSLKFVARGVQGYVDAFTYDNRNTERVGQSGYSVSQSVANNELTIVVNKSSAYTNVLNNTPIALANVAVTFTVS